VGAVVATMAARVARLEEQIAQIARQLDRVEAQMAKAVDLAEVKGRVSQLPTVWQLVGLVLGIFGAAFALLRFGLPR
jgi:hypothetical protein